MCNDSNHMKISFNKNKTTALTYLLTKIFEWIDKIMNKSGEIRRWVHHKYVMSQIIQKIYALKKNCSYLAVTEIFRLNQRNDELYWWIMKVRASKIWNESNHTKNSFKKKNCTYLAVTEDVQLNQRKDKWGWWSTKMSASKM